MDQSALRDLVAVYLAKYEGRDEGWGPRMRLQAGYFSPDEFYEAEVSRLATSGIRWADIGCGRDVFPSNPRLARTLCDRAGYVLGIDPDENVLSNPFVSDRFLGTVEQYEPTEPFDLITLRMVAEHITDPRAVLTKLRRMLKPQGSLVIYTTAKWTPMAVAAMVVPFRFHNALKRLIWNSEARDTFPIAYKLNTRSDLERHTRSSGLKEVSYRRIDDCRITERYRALQWAELRIRRGFRMMGMPYPERCILAVYRPGS